MFAMVEAPSSHLVRLWICVKPWRLYEGLGSRTVEALGLDPLKGVAVSCRVAVVYLLLLLADVAVRGLVLVFLSKGAKNTQGKPS